jgi:hypothetical protein
LIQWVGDEIEVVEADDSVCVAMAESQEELQDGEVKCLTERDLSEYDYISVGQGGFVPMNVKSTTLSRLEDIKVQK